MLSARWILGGGKNSNGFVSQLGGGQKSNGFVSQYYSCRCGSFVCAPQACASSYPRSCSLLLQVAAGTRRRATIEVDMTYAASVVAVDNADRVSAGRCAVTTCGYIPDLKSSFLRESVRTAAALQWRATSKAPWRERDKSINRRASNSGGANADRSVPRGKSQRSARRKLFGAAQVGLAAAIFPPIPACSPRPLIPSGPAKV